MKKIQLILIFLVFFLTGCATNHPSKQESEISVQLQGTSIEVQLFIEEEFRKSARGFRVESANERTIVFKANCMDTPNMNAFKCAAIMMAVGNSRWDGPYAVLTFRTAEIRNTVHLSMFSEWCATNPFGKTNCIPNESPSERNALLRRIEAAYTDDQSKI